jgi:hypothetical protein
MSEGEDFELEDEEEDFEALEAEIAANWTPEDQAQEDRIRKEMQPFRDHSEVCKKGCRFFPISMACYEGAKMMNPDLPDANEEEYLHRMQKGHEDCEWCHGN